VDRLDALIAADCHYHAAFPTASPQQRERFAQACLGALIDPVPALAQDAMPIGLQGETSMPNNSTLPNSAPAPGRGSNALGGVDRRRRARDQAYERRDDDYGESLGMLTPHGPNGDQGSSVDFGPEELGEIVQRCLAGFLDRDANDDTGESAQHNQAMQILAEVLRQAHQNGNNNGMDRRRSRGARDRALAQDAARSRNMEGFAERFPDAMRISVRG
jgi:hypothetical protein